MKNSALICLIILFSGYAYTQPPEFTTYSNGLIYNESTMDKLRFIVDSLNLSFQSCDLNKTFYSQSQTTGHYFHLSGDRVREAQEDIKANISFAKFQEKYPEASIRSDLLLVKFEYEDYKGRDVVEISEISLGEHYGYDHRMDKKSPLLKGDLSNPWLLLHTKKSDHWEESVQGFYVTRPLQSQPIPLQYAQMIGYADCLTDTTTLKLKEDTKNGWVDMPKNWQSLSLKKKEKLLDNMRSTHVVGYCSQDSRPREHAVNIAVLSAETTHWEVFLKAHLDIMNDRFDRASDGSYAWSQRKTYLRELEELNINVTDLMFGISLRVENPAENHYYGSVGRVGRALAESRNKEEVVNAILSMMEDEELDHYNRVLAYYLFMSYNNHIENENERKENTLKLKESIRKLPIFLKAQFPGQ